MGCIGLRAEGLVIHCFGVQGSGVKVMIVGFRFSDYDASASG